MTPQGRNQPESPDVDIIKVARQSYDYLRVIQTGRNLQIVVITLPVDDETGEQTHEASDQILFFVDGCGEVVLEGEVYPVTNGKLVFVPAGSRHNVRNTGGESLSIVTAYSPPELAHGTVHATREEADASAT